MLGVSLSGTDFKGVLEFKTAFSLFFNLGSLERQMYDSKKSVPSPNFFPMQIRNLVIGTEKRGSVGKALMTRHSQ